MRLLNQKKEMINLTERLERVEENVRGNNALLQSIADMEIRLQTVEENLRQHNEILSDKAPNEEYRQLTARMEALKKRMDRLEQKASGSNMGDMAVQTAAIPAREKQSRQAYGDIDYFDFENHFRGSRETIKERQKEYLPYFAGKKAVLDLGCGRGEFLELLGENGISAKGVDFYDEFVQYCQNRGLDVEEGDAIAYLEQTDPVDGIFAGQLAEHLTIGQIIALCSNAYEKLVEGGCLILETPNPMSLAIYTHAFYMDPSHQKPVHPYTLQYLVGKAGFQKVEILFTKGSRLPEHVPVIRGSGIQNAEEFNRDLQTMAEFLYGSQDYAVIAQK